MRPIANAMVAAGHTVEMPRLPGHGTTVADMLTTTWADWSAHVEAVYLDLASRTEKVVVTGLSMGGTLTLWLASRHPEIVGIVPINASVLRDADTRDGIQAFVDSGAEVMDAVGGDIAKPGVIEVAYDQTPLRPLLSLIDAIIDLHGHLADIAMPSLIVTSENDHVVPPESSDRIAATVTGPVERLTLADSFHVATIDHDEQRIVEAIDAFVQKVGNG